MGKAGRPIAKVLALAALGLLVAKLAGLAGLRREARARRPEAAVSPGAARAAGELATAPLPEPPRAPVVSALSAPSAAAASEPSSVPPRAPPSSLTFLVLRDGVPVAGAEIRDGDPGAGLEPSRLWARADEPGLFDDPPATRLVRTDGTGRASWIGLPDGPRAFWLRAPGEERRRAVLAPERPEGTIELGHAAIEGRVYEEDGRPAPDVRLLAQQRSSGGDATLWSLARTDRDGAYAVEGLAGGAQHSVILWGIEAGRGDPGPLRLEPGERRRIDFGSPLGSAQVSGRLRYPSGEAVEDGQPLVFVGAHTSESWTSGASGFVHRLPLGSYRVCLGSPAGAELLAFELDGDRELDLTLPGIVLRGSLRYGGSLHPRASGPEREVVLELLDAEGAPLPQRPIRGERSYAFVGLAPGRYRLATRPWPIAGTPDGQLALELGEAPEEVLAALEITDP